MSRLREKVDEVNWTVGAVNHTFSNDISIHHLKIQDSTGYGCMALRLPLGFVWSSTRLHSLWERFRNIFLCLTSSLACSVLCSSIQLLSKIDLHVSSEEKNRNSLWCIQWNLKHCLEWPWSSLVATHSQNIMQTSSTMMKTTSNYFLQNLIQKTRMHFQAPFYFYFQNFKQTRHLV